MNEHARTCDVCGEQSAVPATGSTSATYDQDSGRLLMPYACAQGHRFVTRIRTEEFTPAG